MVVLHLIIKGEGFALVSLAGESEQIRTASVVFTDAVRVGVLPWEGLLPCAVAPCGRSLGRCQRLRSLRRGGVPRGPCWRPEQIHRLLAVQALRSEALASATVPGRLRYPLRPRAGSELRLPHTLVPPLPRRIEADRIVSESSSLIATIDRSEMLVLNAAGSGRHTVAALLSA